MRSGPGSTGKAALRLLDAIPASVGIQPIAALKGDFSVCEIAVGFHEIPSSSPG